MDGRGPAMLVQAGQNPDAIGKCDVEQRVRETRDERTPRLAMSKRASKRVLGDEVNDEVE